VELPRIAPASFIHPCRPIDAAQPPSGPGGTQRIYTINGADWPKRYPLITATARKIDGSAILDAEVVWIGSDGAAYSDALHSTQTSQETLLIGSPFFVRAQLSR
jgi:ATP-dependent DNA ligase